MVQDAVDYKDGVHGDFVITLVYRMEHVATCRKEEASNTPPTQSGGGTGRGFNNFSGSLLGSAGGSSVCPSCKLDTSFL